MRRNEDKLTSTRTADGPKHGSRWTLGDSFSLRHNGDREPVAVTVLWIVLPFAALILAFAFLA